MFLGWALCWLDWNWFARKCDLLVTKELKGYRFDPDFASFLSAWCLWLLSNLCFRVGIVAGCRH